MQRVLFRTFLIECSAKMSAEKRLQSYMNKYTIIFGCYGLAASFVHNSLLRRPILSGVHRHVIYTAFGAGLGTFLGLIERRQFVKRDHYIDDYIQKHPDDFTKEPPRKMGEVFHVWTSTQPTQ